MRRAFAAALLLPAAWSVAPPPAENAAEPLTVLQLHRLAVVDGRGTYTGQLDGRSATIAYDVPLDRVDPARGHGSELVGSTDGGVVVMVDRYSTRLTGDADPCAEGSEAWVRVFALASARQLASFPVESCRDGVVAGKSVAEWLEGDRFRLHTAPSRVYAIKGESLVAS